MCVYVYVLYVCCLYLHVLSVVSRGGGGIEMKRWEGEREGGREGGRVLERKGRRGREGGREGGKEGGGLSVGMHFSYLDVFLSYIHIW